jgi:hypothetical protein
MLCLVAPVSAAMASSAAAWLSVNVMLSLGMFSPFGLSLV